MAIRSRWCSSEETTSPGRAQDSISNVRPPASSDPERHSICPASRWPSSVAKRKDRGVEVDHPHRTVPRPRHPHEPLVAQGHVRVLAARLLKASERHGGHLVGVMAERRHQPLRAPVGVEDRAAVAAAKQGAGTVLGSLHAFQRHRALRKRRRPVELAPALQLPAVDRRRAPDIAPRRDRHPRRPHGGHGGPVGERNPAGHYPSGRRRAGSRPGGEAGRSRPEGSGGTSRSTGPSPVSRKRRPWWTSSSASPSSSS